MKYLDRNVLYVILNNRLQGLTISIRPGRDTESSSETYSFLFSPT